MSKIYTRRDSVTTILRKAGIDKADYNKYIKVVDGGFTIEDPRFPALKPEAKPAKKTGYPNRKADVIAKAQHQIKVAESKKQAKKPPVKVVYEEIASPSKSYRVDPNNITNTIKTLILDGKTNKEIWDIIQPQFAMSENKRHYPAWYRSQMKRRGELS